MTLIRMHPLALALLALATPAAALASPGPEAAAATDAAPEAQAPAAAPAGSAAGSPVAPALPGTDSGPAASATDAVITPAPAEPAGAGNPGTAAGAASATPGEAPAPVMVIVASRLQEPIAQVVSSVAVVKREDLEKQVVADSADAVRYVPGLRVDADATRFGSRGFAIRGLGGNRVRTEIDGVPLPDGYAVGRFSSAGRDLINLEAIDRVEIMRGPASTLYGSDALAGIVALRTRSIDDLLDGATVRRQLRADYNGRNDSHLLGVTVAAQGGEGWQGMALAARRDGHATDNTATRAKDAPNPADFSTGAFLGKLSKDAGAAGRWNLILDHSAQSTQTDVVSQRFASGQFSNTFLLLADDRTARDRVSVGADWEAPVAGIDTLGLLVYGQDSGIRQDTRQYRDVTNPILQWRRFDFEQRDLGVDLLAQTRATTGPVRHWLVYGTELETTRYEGQRDGLQTTLATGATTNVMLGESYPVRDYPTSTAERAAVFVQDELRLGPVSLIPALRFEHYRLDAEPDAMFRQDYPNNRVVNLSEQSLTRRLGLRWALSPHQHLFLQAAEGFRAPPFNDVNIALTVVTTGTYEVRPNPDLRPETSKGVEAGWRWEGEMLKATLSAFDNHYRDLIESRANLGVDPVSGATVFQSVNRARARIAGFEAEATARLDELLPMAGWTVRLAGSAVRGEDRVRDKPLNSVDPDKAVLGIGYEAPAKGWGAEFVTTAVDRMSRVDAGTPKPFVPPGYVVFDAYGWYVPWKDGRLSLALQNLGDHRHWDWSAVQGVSATAANTGFYSRPGLGVSVGITQGW